MKKLTLVIGLIFCLGVVNAQVERKWKGSDVQASSIWDNATANWYDPAFPFPLPTTFADSAHAIFDDSILKAADTLKISGVLKAASVKVNATKNYLIRKTADTDELIGGGSLIKEGTGSLIMDFKNSLTGGVILKNGVLVQERQNSPNIYGSGLTIEGGKLTVGFAGNTSSAYTVSNAPITIPAGKTAQIELPRYSTFYNKIKGSGNLEILCTGERVHMGYTTVPAGLTSAMPDLSEFTGNLKIVKQTATWTPGFWGLVLSTNKTFKDSLNGFNIDSTFYNKKVLLGSGATLATHSGTRAFAIGELTSEDATSVLCGYRSASNSPRIYFFVGGLNTDVVYPGRIAQAPGITSSYTHVCFVKMGTGTYTLTHPNNQILGGIIVREGTVLINDPLQQGNYLGGVGGIVKTEVNGTLGGTGRIQGNVDIYGKLKPGSNGVGTLLITDTLTAYASSGAQNGVRKFNLTFQPGSEAEFEIQSATSYDKVVLTGALKFNNDVNNVLPNPVIKIKLTPGYQINDGDSFEIIKADSLFANNVDFTIQYPVVNNISWSTQTEVVGVSPKSYKLFVKAKVASGIKSPFTNKTSVYPNPVSGSEATFNVQDGVIRSIEIISLQGQIIRTENVDAQSMKLNLSDLKAGLYYARVSTDNGQELHKLIIR